MAVFPENMDKLSADDVPGSLSIIENYIRYMGERMEFAMRNMTKTVSAAGVSSAEMYILLTALQNTVSAISSTIQSISGEITDMKTNVASAMSAAESANNYENNTNKPKINGTELIGDKTNQDIHIRELTNAEIQEILSK